MPRWAWCFVIVLLLAGCSAKTPAEEPDDAQPSSLGRISGAAVTPDIRPISGAAITMQPGNFETDSNLFGGFAFENVPPGSYELTATHGDYAPTTEVINVVAGEITKARIVLKSNEPPVPQHATETFTGSIALSAGPAEEATSDAQTAAGVGECTCVFDIPAQANMATVVIEVIWTDSIEPAEPTTFRWSLEVRENLTLSGSGAKPMRAYINAEDVGGWANTTTVRLTIAPDEVWPATNQEFTAYVTIFQVAPAPADWTFMGS